MALDNFIKFYSQFEPIIEEDMTAKRAKLQKDIDKYENWVYT